MKPPRVHTSLTPLLVCGLATCLIGAPGTQTFAKQPSLEELQRSENVYRVKVRYNISDLATESGTDRIYRRIKGAAHRVCEAASEPSDAARIRHYWQCYNQAVAQAVSDVNNQKLTAFHQREADKRKPAG